MGTFLIRRQNKTSILRELVQINVRISAHYKITVRPDMYSLATVAHAKRLVLCTRVDRWQALSQLFIRVE